GAMDGGWDNRGGAAPLVLLTPSSHWPGGLRRPPWIAVFSTPLLRAAARAAVRRWPGLDRRFYTWQVGGFIADPAVRDQLVPRLYQPSLSARPAFWRLHDHLLPAVARPPPRL